jgi:outer membrane protein OmpA-like peptidoglycan-associated protein
MKKIPVLAALVLVLMACQSPPPPPQSAAAAPHVTSPQLRVTFSPNYFSPDDGDLAIYLFVVDDSPIKSWKVAITEPQPPYLPLYEWGGEGQPPEMISWNGKNKNGELVLSATDYPFAFTVSNTLGLSSTLNSFIEVDVFVIKEGATLRIQIPSIVFGSNSGSFDGLNAQDLDNNDWILKRLAQILSKFPDYRIRVEGHANPTISPRETARRENEQSRELLPLSEIRAATIVNYLVRLGIQRERLSSVGVGGGRPLAAWEDRDNWWKNRRVEFILIK